MHSRKTFPALMLNFAFAMAAPGYADEQPVIGEDVRDSANLDLCKAFGNRAAGARLARQKQELAALKDSIEQNAAVLAEKIEKLQTLVEKREQDRASVSVSLTKIYSNVEPDLAAKQLEKLSTEQVAELLQRLDPKVSGEILNAMDIKFAGKIARLMMLNSSLQKKVAQTP
jgi:flagellar motility protein MotE (MotC chaperone)